MDKQFYINKRNEFFGVLPDRSFAVINSGVIYNRTLDNEFPFEVDRNFYYFSGIAFPNMKLIMAKSGQMQRCMLFIPRSDVKREKWVGKIPSLDECRAISGIEDIFFEDEADELIYNMAVSRDYECAYMPLDPVEKGKPRNKNNAEYLVFRKKYPSMEVHDVNRLIYPMRAVKSEQEIEAIKEAAEITKFAIHEMMKNIKPTLKEYEAQACFEYVVKRKGAKVAFNTIAASGANATILHYTSNKAALKDGDLLLVDCGASKNWYNADVTRTIPVNGKFTDRQLELYKIVLGANKHIIGAVKPGLTCNDLNDLLKDYFFKTLKSIGLIASEEEVADYYYHGVSHHLGLDVHDVGLRGEPLKPGMVITVEPGLYVAEYGIGIRIEDDVLVTAKGCEVLTDVLKEPEEIEEFMDIWEVK
jgi:Xaa-Pro aminopeptidase